MNNYLLKKLREDIDQIDYDILKLIKKRQQTAEMIGMVKYENNLKIHTETEYEVINNLKAQGLVDPKIVDNIWKILFENSKWLQKN